MSTASCLQETESGQLQSVVTKHKASLAGPPRNPVQPGGKLGTQPWKGPWEMARLRRPQEGTAVGLHLSFRCLKLCRGFWVLAFLTFLEASFFRFL